MDLDRFELAARIFLFGPLLFLGLTMFVNPSGFLLSLASLSDRFGAFREHLEDYDWPSNSSMITRVPHAVVRVAGFGLAVSTVVAFALVPNP